MGRGGFLSALGSRAHGRLRLRPAGRIGEGLALELAASPRRRQGGRLGLPGPEPGHIARALYAAQRPEYPFHSLAPCRRHLLGKGLGRPLAQGLEVPVPGQLHRLFRPALGGGAVHQWRSRLHPACGSHRLGRGLGHGGRLGLGLRRFWGGWARLGCGSLRCYRFLDSLLCFPLDEALRFRFGRLPGLLLDCPGFRRPLDFPGFGRGPFRFPSRPLPKRWPGLRGLARLRDGGILQRRTHRPRRRLLPQSPLGHDRLVVRPLGLEPLPFRRRLGRGEMGCYVFVLPRGGLLFPCLLFFGRRCLGPGLGRSLGPLGCPGLFLGRDVHGRLAGRLRGPGLFCLPGACPATFLLGRLPVGHGRRAGQAGAGLPLDGLGQRLRLCIRLGRGRRLALRLDRLSGGDSLPGNGLAGKRRLLQIQRRHARLRLDRRAGNHALIPLALFQPGLGCAAPAGLGSLGRDDRRLTPLALGRLGPGRLRRNSLGVAGRGCRNGLSVAGRGCRRLGGCRLGRRKRLPLQWGAGGSGQARFLVPAQHLGVAQLYRLRGLLPGRSPGCHGLGLGHRALQKYLPPRQGGAYAGMVKILDGGRGLANDAAFHGEPLPQDALHHPLRHALHNPFPGRFLLRLGLLFRRQGQVQIHLHLGGGRLRLGFLRGIYEM